MVLFLLFFAHYVGVSRRQHSFGIALGFGSFAVVELVLICSFVGNHLGGAWLSILNMAAYNASLVVWFGYVVVKRPARDASASLLQPQRWEQSLYDIHHPLPADSLIPMFDAMVDRAISRTRQDLAAHEVAHEVVHKHEVAHKNERAPAAAASAAAATGGFSIPVVPVSSKT
jgi:hypothetical protein